MREGEEVLLAIPRVERVLDLEPLTAFLGKGCS